MTDTAPDREPEKGEHALPQPAHSVLDLIASRTGEAPRITLRDEDSVAASSPVIDPRSQEKLSLPQGRGTYQLMGEIARGGMGVILKGHDTDLGRDVALKVLDKRLAERPEVVQRFVEEAQIGGQLQHPGIVPVYELGLMADERPYFTMKLVKGRTLANLLAEREGPKAERARLIDVFESVCQTMAYAHSRGVIHRDLKPANIMVGAFGEVQVVDWGLAKVLARGGTADEKRARRAHEQSQLTVLETVRSAEGSSSGSESMVGSVMGTPAYMPPEQASGKVDRLDERSDVFALGAILCEILTGLPPYVGERSDVIAAAAQGDYDDALARLDACEADPELVKLTKQCLMAAPAARPANAGVVAERVHQHLVSVEERAQTAQVEAASAQVRAHQERKARRLTVALGAAGLAIVLVVGGGWAWLQNERAAQDRADAQRQQEAAARERTLATEVNEELAAASMLQGGERWDEAIVAGERAQALAQGGGAGEELRARVDEVLAGLRSGAEAARRQEERERDKARLLAELEEVREPEWSDDRDNFAHVAEQYERTFLAHGIQLDAAAPEDAASELAARGFGPEIALVLDAWSDARRRSEDEPGALRLLEVAHLVDPDPVRADLREALENHDLDVLRWIVDSGFDDQPASTIELLASGLARLGERDLAWQVFRRGIERHPDDFALHYQLGRLLTPAPLVSGPEAEMEEGVSCYRAALAIRPESVTLRYFLGRLYGKLNEEQRALEQYEIALESRPGDPTFLFHRGVQLRSIGQPERSLAVLEPLTEVQDPDWIAMWSHNGAGLALLDLGRPAEALEHFRAAVDRGPFMQLFHSNLVQSAIEVGDPETIERTLRDGLERLPANAAFLNNLSWFLATSTRRELRDPHEAVRYGERAVEFEPDDANNWNTLGGARYYAGDYEGAVDALLRSVRISGSGMVIDWLLLAMAYHRLGDARSAGFWHERAVQWLDANRGTYDPDFDRFRAEADAVLGG